MSDPQPMEGITSVVRRMMEHGARVGPGWRRALEPTPASPATDPDPGPLELALARQSRARSALLKELRDLVTQWTNRAKDTSPRTVGSESFHLGASAAWSLAAEQLSVVLLNNRPGGDERG